MNSVKSVVLALCLSFSFSAFAADLTAVKSGVGKGVDGKELVDEGNTFHPGDKVYGLFLIANPGAEEAAKLVWKHGDKVKGSLDVTIGRSKTGWKTYGQHQMGKKSVGAWTCELQAGDGTVIASAAFTVE